MHLRLSTSALFVCIATLAAAQAPMERRHQLRMLLK